MSKLIKVEIDRAKWSRLVLWNMNTDYGCIIGHCLLAVGASKEELHILENVDLTIYTRLNSSKSYIRYVMSINDKELLSSEDREKILTDKCVGLGFKVSWVGEYIV